MSKKEIAASDSPNETDTDEKNVLNTFETPFMTAIMRRQVLREMVKALPAPVQNRIVALKNLQLEQLALEAKFYQEVYSLEKAYHAKYQNLYNKRMEIVTGSKNPSAEKPNWKETEDEMEITDKVKEISLKMQAMKPALDENVTGIPNFWLTIIRNSELLSGMVHDHDEPVLKKLRDIKIKYLEDNEQSYILEFHFDENEYFSNPILTKQYFLKSAIDDDYPFSFEGPEIYKCVGCDINWEKGMNLTIKTIRKKQKHKERGAVRTVTKQVPNDTFFNFFYPPEISDDKDEVDEDSQAILATDFEIGHLLRARIIPKAVLYYTGDVVDDDDDGDEYDEEEEEDEDEGDEISGDEKTAYKAKKPNPNECQNQ